ncbi:pleckstrin homology domain-containing family G member 7-like [Acipenser ruthenus]|uniref:pleckstrin homology domain-containing family G member 7-like n=1 Tax=Acipenser ruthenus TaxID=7906 RepID=UPI0027421E5E|nr:pleckstrin homology domain-containing family G member 7-like [Acipenser ruthenus]XP_058842158.1 pleckstrin homology domain-containing family G member 7-like [Acipenser ruthenus]XP_058842159.1 pleckstrin homology domain-containing family G member 7-like [Acipenser ruthenus]
MQQPEDVLEKAEGFETELGWTVFTWQKQNGGLAGHSIAETQTGPVHTEDKETQTSSPMIQRLLDQDGAVKPFSQFDRQAPARISTSPTLRRMRKSIRRPQLQLDLWKLERQSNIPADTANVSVSQTNLHVPGTHTSCVNNQRSPLARDASSPVNCSEDSAQDCLEGISPPQEKQAGDFNNKLDNDLIYNRPKSHSARKIGSGKFHPSNDCHQVTESTQKRMQERRRSSVVVSLPGLDVSPGDLFVSDGAADYLSRSTLSDTKKSKWPFLKRGTSKDKLKLLSDVEKCLSSIQIQDWRLCDFQKYKDKTLAEFLAVRHPNVELQNCQHGYKREEAVWELFTSECVYFLDQLMVLKEVFLSTLNSLQSSDCLLDVDVWRLFANLNELCLVSFSFLTSLLKGINDSWANVDKSMTSLETLLTKHFKESVCHCQQKYCLNYSSAVFYLDSLKQREDFGTYLKWCERNEQCKRLHLSDMLVAPMQRFTRYPLLLKNIWKRSTSEEEKIALQYIIKLVEGSIQDLEGKVKWLHNFQTVQQLQEMIVWPPVWERDKRAFIPDNLKHVFKQTSLENLISSNQNLLHEGRLNLTGSTKVQEVYLFLFDDFLLITKNKRSKKKSVSSEQATLCPPVNQELQTMLKDGGTFHVVDQPISLDRVLVKNIDQLNATGCGLRNAFIVMHQNRYQQCIGVFILQAQTESSKKAWILEIEKAAEALSRSETRKPMSKNSPSWLESSQI